METREISKLKPNPQNPRGAVAHDSALLELAASIKSHGVLQPLVITPNDLIVAGHRRFEAAKLAGLESVPVVVKKLSQIEQLQIMLIENLQRADLNVVQEGAAFKALVDYGLTPSQIAKATGISGSRISNCIAIQVLPPDVQTKFAAKQIALSCATVLTTLTTAEDQSFWASAAAGGKWNSDDLRHAINHEGRAPRRKVLDSYDQVVARTITRLQHIDEGLEYSRSFSEVQGHLRDAIRLLNVMKQAKAA